MGLMDSFTSDSPVTVKQPDYYAMVKEAAKAELITNAVNAEVPGHYIRAMITGKKPDFLNTLDAEEEETGFRTEYEQITGAVVSIFEAWEKENGVESAADGLHRLIDDLSKNRIEELRVIRENREAENAIMRKLLIPPLCGDESGMEDAQKEVAAAVEAGADIKSEEIKQMSEEKKKKRKTAEDIAKEQNVSDTDTSEEEKANAKKLHAVKMLEKYYIYLSEEETGILERMLEDCKRRKREYALEED